MEKARYWAPRGATNGSNMTAGLKDLFSKFRIGFSGSVNFSEPEGSMTKKNGSNGLLKGIGAGSGVVLLLIAIFAILVLIFVIRPAYTLLSSVNALRKDADNLKQAMVGRDLVLFNATLDKTEKDLRKLKTERDAKFAWVKTFPMVETYYVDSDHFIDAGLHGVAAGRELEALVTPFADAVGLRIEPTKEKPKLSKEEEGLMEAFQAWVSVMPQVAENMDGVLLELSKIGDEMAKVDASKYPVRIWGVPLRGAIEGAKTTLSRVNDNAPDIKIALKLIPALLGVGTGEKRYGIIMQNDAEIRATGGFWTNYATFKVNNGLLTSDFTSKDMYSIDTALEPIDTYIDFPDVPLAYTKYLKVERMFARDANISPDFPTAIDQFMYFYNMANEQMPWDVKPVDGFFAMDTVVVKELLGITGPVTVNGTTFTQDNVVLELEKIASLSLQEQVGRKRVLGDLMEGMLLNVFESDKNLWSKLVDKGVDLVNRKHIVAYVFDPQAQQLLEKYNYAGRIVDPVEGDYVYAVSTNLGGDKTNLFVKKQVTSGLVEQ